MTSEPDGPMVETINTDYDRTTSRVLVRKVAWPSRGALDFAVYDANVMTFDPEPYEPLRRSTPLHLMELSFNGALDASTVCDRIEQTPLSDEERDRPLAWRAMIDALYMVDRVIDPAMALAETGSVVSGQTWGNDTIPVPCQQIARAYVHDTGESAELWVRVECAPWFAPNVAADDEDNDHFPEWYGRIPATRTPAVLIDVIRDEYLLPRLFPAEVMDWAYTLGSNWYPTYNTETLDRDQMNAWPDDEARGVLGETMTLPGVDSPTIVIRGTPFTQRLYNVLIVE